MPKKKNQVSIAEMHENEASEPVDTHVFDYIKENHTIFGANYNVLPYLPINAQIIFVKYITDTVFTDSGYTPALFDYAQRYATMVCYTDIVVPSNENSANDTCEVLYGTTLIEDILSKIDTAQYNALVSAAHDQIANTNNLIVSYNPADDMYTSINSILDKMNAWLDKNLKKLNIDKKMLTRIQDIATKFSNVNQEDIVHAVVDKMGTENNVVQFPKEK